MVWMRLISVAKCCDGYRSLFGDAAMDVWCAQKAAEHTGLGWEWWGSLVLVLDWSRMAIANMHSVIFVMMASKLVAVFCSQPE